MSNKLFFFLDLHTSELLQYTNLQHKPMVVHKTLQVEKEFRI